MTRDLIVNSRLRTRDLIVNSRLRTRDIIVNSRVMTRLALGQALLLSSRAATPQRWLLTAAECRAGCHSVLFGRSQRLRAGPLGAQLFTAQSIWCCARSGDWALVSVAQRARRVSLCRREPSYTRLTDRNKHRHKHSRAVHARSYRYQETEDLLSNRYLTLLAVFSTVLVSSKRRCGV